MNDECQYMSPKDLAEELGVPLATAHHWRHAGTGPVGYKIGRHVRYLRSDVEAWLLDRRDA